VISELNGAQRFWLMLVLVLLASTFAVIALSWPKRQPEVVADLDAPECASWRGLPVEKIPDAVPEPGQQCYPIRSLIFREHVSIASLDDYDSYLTGRGLRKAGWLLLGWAIFAVLSYVLAWSSARTVTAMLRRGGNTGNT